MYSFEYLNMDNVLAKVSINNGVVKVVNYTNDVVDKPFGNCKNPTVDNVKELFIERCFPETRFNAKQILKEKPYGYDVFSIVRDTHGVLVDDCYWVRFSGEDLTWNDVKHLRNFKN